eukprot:CAMPEP_0184301158 /NCGR_PEP_ID=MMETSP1049-20130417/11419_1 /TAXON_ID=77928 /ORGANISM="Proteomonas sulcata, Strain CCMP704" /LENGTH=126 /DNA_ID=CAMNT_0026612073 /DNA_START=158 /DNA_END=539 /DNA_ORIENTATION=+
MVFHTFISLDLFGAQWADTNNGGPMGNNLVGEEGSSLGFGSYDSRVSGANQLPAGMTATAWGSGPHYGNMGGRMVFPIPTGAGNLQVTQGRSGAEKELLLGSILQIRGLLSTGIKARGDEQLLCEY